MTQNRQHNHLSKPVNGAQNDCARLILHLCNASKDAIIIYDNETCIQAMSRQAEVLFGYSICDIQYKVIDLILPTLSNSENDYLTQMTSGLNACGTSFPVEMMVTEFSVGNVDYHLAIIRDMSHPVNESGRDLSPRQRQVLKLVVQGYTSREIAEKLTISIKTVETHRANIMTKLGVSNVSSLVRLAVEQDII